MFVLVLLGCFFGFDVIVFGGVDDCYQLYDVVVVIYLVLWECCESDVFVGDFVQVIVDVFKVVDVL